MSQNLSIKEFAKRAGITPQAVYKQLDNKLKPFLIMVDGKKALKIEALDLFRSNQENNGFNNELQTVVNLLKDQLAEKDRQIEALNEALMRAQQLTDQAQHLQAAAEKKVQLLEAPKKHKWQFWKKSEDSANDRTDKTIQ